MQILNTKTDKELMQTVLAEIAKARNELKCAEADVKKVNNRISFLISVANELHSRYEGK